MSSDYIKDYLSLTSDYFISYYTASSMFSKILSHNCISVREAFASI